MRKISTVPEKGPGFVKLGGTRPGGLRVWEQRA